MQTVLLLANLLEKMRWQQSAIAIMSLLSLSHLPLAVILAVLSLYRNFFGAKDYAKMKTAVYTTLISSTILCAILMLLGFLFCDTLLAQMRTQPEILSDSALYMDIYILGLPFLFFYNIATGIFSALGDSKTPFYFLAFSSISNIAVDILFVKWFHMGIAGIAWATFLCQGISCILSLILILKRLSQIKIAKKAALFSSALLKNLL